MKNVNFTLATIITLLIGSYCAAQTPHQVVKLFLTSNSNMPTQIAAPLTFMFGDGNSDSLFMPDAGNEGSLGQYNDQVFPFSITADNNVVTQLDARPELLSYRNIPMGFVTKGAAAIEVIAIISNTSGDSLNTTIGFVWLEQLSTGKKLSILNEAAITIKPSNDNKN